MTRLSECDIRRRGLDADDVTGRGDRGDGHRQSPGPRSNVQYDIDVANPGKSHQQRHQLSTPSAHEALVRIASRKHPALRPGASAEDARGHGGHGRHEQDEDEGVPGPSLGASARTIGSNPAATTTAPITI
jgi:hypothetical protein